MATTVRFSTHQFVRSHMHEPKGRGSWAFQIEDDKEVLWSPSMTYSEAKKWARDAARKRLDVLKVVLTNVYVDVLP